VLLLRKPVDVAVGDAAGSSSTFYWPASQYIPLRVALGGVGLVGAYL
jgi:hypothetical protein